MAAGGVTRTVSLPETASGEFSTVSFTADLSAGTNMIILATNADRESADIDWIAFSTSASFLRMDAAADGTIDIADALFVLSYLFVGGAVPTCLDAADGNDDGAVDISDAVQTLLYLFRQAEPPPDPFGTCGGDPTPDALGCLFHEHCQ
jgi:hypothetical protein